MSKRAYTTMHIPTDKADKVSELLELLEMKDESSDSSEVEEDFSDCEDNQQYEVTGVVSHRIDRNGQFTFKVRFRGRTYEWVKDKDCNCERYIQEYLGQTETNNMKFRTVYGLCRVSSQNQTGPTHVSLPAQEETVRETARSIELKRNEILRVKIFSIATSAYRGIPQILTYISECARPRDILVTYRVDRLSRNIVKFLALLEQMNDDGIFIYAQDEDLWYHNRKLDFLQHILDANKEGALISKRVKQSVDYRRRRGDYIGSAPYGFKLQRNEHGVVSKVRDEKEKKIIHQIKNGTRNLNRFRQLVSKFNRTGVTKRGKKWNVSMIRYVYDKN